MENIEKTLDFKPIRLDWTADSVRSQIFYKGGHHIGSIPVNADGTFNKESNTYQKIKYLLENKYCLLYTSPSPRDLSTSRMPSSA